MTHPAHTHDDHDHDHDHDHSHPHPHAPAPKPALPRSVLAWPAWLRVLAVLPVVLALWLAVGWANAGASPW